MPKYTRIMVQDPKSENYVETECTLVEARIIDLLEETVAALGRLNEAIENLSPVASQWLPSLEKKLRRVSPNRQDKPTK